MALASSRNLPDALGGGGKRSHVHLTLPSEDGVFKYVMVAFSTMLTNTERRTLQRNAKGMRLILNRRFHQPHDPLPDFYRGMAIQLAVVVAMRVEP
jgi:hypothetical protein